MKLIIKRCRNSTLLVTSILAVSGCGGSSGDGGTSSPRAVLLPVKSGWRSTTATDSSVGAGTIVGQATTATATIAVAWSSFKVQPINCTDPKLIFTGACGISENGLHVVGNGQATRSTVANVLLIGNSASLSPVEPPPGKVVKAIYPFDISNDGDSWGYLEYEESGGSKPSYFFRTREGTWTITPDLGALSSVKLEKPPLAIDMTIAAISEDRNTAFGFVSFVDGSTSVLHPTAWKDGKPTVLEDVLDGTSAGFSPLEPSVSSDGSTFIYSPASGITLVGSTLRRYTPLADVIRSAGVPIANSSDCMGRISNSGDSLIGAVKGNPFVVLRYK